MEPQVEEEYAEWVSRQEVLARELGLALQGQDVIDVMEEQLQEIVERAAQEYQHYFRATRTTSRCTFTILSSSSVSPLERAFLWLGGMRPSLSFQLIYSVTAHQSQAELLELLELGTEAGTDGESLASLASLSALQLAQLSDLQTSTTAEEDTIEREIAKLQQNAAEQPLMQQILGSVEESETAPPLPRTSSTITEADDDISRGSLGGMHSAISSKLASLEEMFIQANALRLSTVHRVLDILHTPFQKAGYLLAAAKLHVALRALGLSTAPPSAR